MLQSATMFSSVIKKTTGTVLKAVEGFGSALILLGQSIAWLFRPPFRASLFLQQMEFVGFGSLFIVVLTGLFTGMVFAVQTVQTFRLFNAETLVGSTVSLVLMRELAPVLTSLMVTARVGSAIATELGTMRVTEQIDALRTLGTDPIRYLVVPRFLACFFLIPVLAIFSVFIGVVAGYLVCVKALEIDSYAYLQNTRDMMQNWDIGVGIFKSFFFGSLIAVICCYKGFTCGKGAEGVGRATTEAFVFSFIAILVADLFLSVLLRFIYNIYLV